MDENVTKDMEKFEKFENMSQEEMLKKLKACKIQRIQRKVNQTRMAEILGTTVANISVYENKNVFEVHQKLKPESVFRMIRAYESEFGCEII